MILQNQSYIDNNGRLALSAQIRNKMNLKTGDKVLIKYEDGKLVVSTYHYNLESLRELTKQHCNTDLMTELQKLRKEDHE